MKIITAHFDIKNLLIAFVLIYATDSLVIGTNINRIYFYISCTLLSTVAIILFLRDFIRNSNFNRNFLFVLLMIFSVCVSMVFNGDFSANSVFVIPLLLLGYYLSRMDVAKICVSYIQLMRIIAVVSILAIILKDIIIQSDLFPIVINRSHSSVYFLLFTNINTSAADMLYRNFGPMWEPGVYQAYLLVALYFELILHKLNVTDFFIFTLAIISTFSTTGFIAEIIFCVAAISAYNVQKKVKYSIYICLLLILLLLLIPSVNNILFKKFSPDANMSSSLARYYSLTKNIELFFENPILGVGFSRINDFGNSFIITTASTESELHNTNTITYLFACFGLVFGGCWLSLFYKTIKANTSKFGLFTSVLILLLFTVLYSCERFAFSLMFYCLLFMVPSVDLQISRNAGSHRLRPKSWNRSGCSSRHNSKESLMYDRHLY